MTKNKFDDVDLSIDMHKRIKRARLNTADSLLWLVEEGELSMEMSLEQVISILQEEKKND